MPAEEEPTHTTATSAAAAASIASPKAQVPSPEGQAPGLKAALLAPTRLAMASNGVDTAFA